MAECRSARRLATPQERVREASASAAWRRADRKIGIKNSELRRRDSVRRRRLRGKEDEEHGASAAENANDGGQLTPEEYDAHLATVAQNQATLKHWVDSAPCNFAHWHRLVEVLLHTAVSPKVLVGPNERARVWPP